MPLPVRLWCLLFIATLITMCIASGTINQWWETFWFRLLIVESTLLVAPFILALIFG